MTARLWTRAKPILALAILAYLIYFVLDRRDLLRNFFAHGPLLIVVVSGGLLVQNLLQAGLLKVLLKPLGLDLPIPKTLALSFLSATAGMLLPFQAGVGVKAVYLKRTYRLSYTSVVVSSLVNVLTKVITCAIVALLTLPFIGSLPHAGAVTFLLVPVILTPPVLYLFVRIPAERIPSPRLREIAREFRWAWRAIRDNRRSIVTAFVIQFSVMAVNAAVFYWMFRALGETMPFFLLTAYTALKFVASAAAILPANLGVPEAITGLFADLAAMSFEGSVMAALIVRLISTLIVLIGAAIATVSGVLER